MNLNSHNQSWRNISNRLHISNVVHRHISNHSRNVSIKNKTKIQKSSKNSSKRRSMTNISSSSNKSNTNSILKNIRGSKNVTRKFEKSIVNLRPVTISSILQYQQVTYMRSQR